MLPREIQVQNWPDRTRYDLPMRPIGALRWIGLAPMAFAVLFAWAPARAILSSLLRMGEGRGSDFGWFFVLFLSVFVFAALLPFALGLFVLIGRNRVLVTADRIIATELAGPLRWSRIIRFRDIARLEHGPTKTNTPAKTPALLKNISGIVAIHKDGRKQPIVIGYPDEWLQPLLREITSHMQLRGTVVPVQEAALPTRSTELAASPRHDRPAESNIELDASGWSVKLTAPSRGLWKDSHGLLVFGLLWCLVVGAVSAGILFSRNHSGNAFTGVLVPGLFWVIGLALLLSGIHLGSRHWTLLADRSALRIRLKSWLRSREWNWAAGEVEDVRVGASGTEVNDRPIEQLQVLSRPNGKRTGLLSGRTHEELEWVATTLRAALGRAHDGEAAPPRIDAARKQS